ncbi:hypothetical protein P5673_019602 [Acropora cervicornis]|uniref:Uncharacterized protein n=1 Tax=Acropora cervicornis TaxID=6130 RepID=A0AAD9V1N9_ACRCE|nr:hypothetical protein P5673_019602 [Acropora cervicornis]
MPSRRSRSYTISGALEALNRIWLSLVAYMESRPNNDDQARGLRKSLREFKSVASLCMMMDSHSNFYEHGFTEKTCRSFFSSGNELETLLAYYGTAKKTQSGDVVPVIVDTENCRIEWKFAKVLLEGVVGDIYNRENVNSPFQKVHPTEIMLELLRLTPFNNSYNLSKHPIVLLPWETCESPRQKERKILQQIVIASTRKFSGRPWFSASLRCHNPANCVQITSGPTFAKRKGSPTACVPSLFVSNVLSLAPKVDELRRAVMHANLDLVRITELWLTRHIHDKTVIGLSLRFWSDSPEVTTFSKKKFNHLSFCWKLRLYVVYASNKRSPMIKFVQLTCISWLRLTSPPILSVLKAVVTGATTALISPSAKSSFDEYLLPGCRTVLVWNLAA